MRFVLSSAALLLLAPATLPAQHSTAIQVAVHPRPADVCPVDLAVSRHADGTLMPAGRRSEKSQTHQWLDLSMTNMGRAPIVSAELDVHGTENKGRVVTAGSASAAELRTDDSGADAVRHVHLDSRVAAAGSWSHLLAVDGLTSVAWVNIMELRYADGSRWRPGAGQSCRVEPDPLMLIADR